MLKLELDWVDDEESGGVPVPVGPQGDGVSVELVQEHGLGGGWPVVAVYAEGASGAESGPRLWAWLVEQGWSEDDASELCDGAESV